MDCSYLSQTFVNEVRLVLVKQNRPFIVAFTLKLIGHLIASYFVIQIMSLNACRFAFRTSNELITPKKRTSIVANCLFCKVLRDFFNSTKSQILDSYWFLRIKALSGAVAVWLLLLLSTVPCSRVVSKFIEKQLEMNTLTEWHSVSVRLKHGRGTAANRF